MVTIYTKTNCQPCRATKRAFDRAGVVYDEQPAVDHVAALKGLGYTGAPVVVVTDGDDVVDHWSGFRPERIAGLKVV